jgi:hypothetical protein
MVASCVRCEKKLITFRYGCFKLIALVVLIHACSGVIRKLITKGCQWLNGGRN